MTCDLRYYRQGKGSAAVDIDDNGRVAYAYLLDENGTIVSDVWLYNSAETPQMPEWQDKRLMPFANPIDYVDVEWSAKTPLIENEADVQVTWEVEGGMLSAYVHLFGELFAVLQSGAKPGWSRLAAKSGPLAKVLPKMS